MPRTNAIKLNTANPMYIEYISQIKRPPGMYKSININEEI